MPRQTAEYFRQYRLENADSVRRNEAKYRLSEESRIKKTEYYKKWFLKNKEKIKSTVQYSARRKFREKVKEGKIKKKPCEICKEIKVDGHHEDYSKPLEVRWLCRKHHAEVHRKYNPLVLPKMSP